MGTKETILPYLSRALQKRLSAVEGTFFDRAEALRIRVDKPFLLYAAGREYAMASDETAAGANRRCLWPLPGPLPPVYRPTAADLRETLEHISRYSLYAFEEELRMGYITLPGGHRVGVVGRTSVENRTVRGIKNISGLNIRLAHQVTGCADEVLPRLFPYEAGRLCHTMIISPPGGGKTTLLRDIVRQLSDGVPGLCAGMTVGLVDERSEIAGCFRGVAQNDVGSRTDVLDGCPKAEGMSLLLRAMAPDVIAVDELGGEPDAVAADDVLNAGVRLVCTAHGRDMDEVRRKPTLRGLLGKGVFERFVVLRAPGAAAAVYDGRGRLC